jgi:hypothetical protein
VVSKDNFLKLRVGMTLKELEDIIGVGEPAAYATQGKDWQQAVREYRVYKWKGTQRYIQEWSPIIMAGFSNPPSAAPDTRVEALSYRDERKPEWNEGKGTLSGAKK